LDDLKANYAPVQTPIPFYLKAPGVAERVLFVKPRGIRYDWETARRIGVTPASFMMYAEDPRIYDSALINNVVDFGGVSGLGLGFTPPSLFDDFSRTVSNDWGTADSGHTYTLTGTAADFDVPGTGSSTITLTAATGSVYLATPNVTNAIDQWFFSTSNSLSAIPTGGTISIYQDFRVVDANNYYRVEVIYTTSNTVQVSLIRVVGGAPTTMTGPTTVGGLTSATATNIRAEITRGSGSAILSHFRAKLWQAGTAEPDPWAVEVVDSNITATGGTRVGAVRNAGNTNSNPVVFRGSIRWMQGISFSVNFGGGAVPSGVNLTNSGNRPTPVVFMIDGPIENPIIYNTTSGHTLAFDITLGASDTLTVDTLNRTVVFNDTSNRRNTLTNPDWFFLEVGVNQIFFGGQNGSGSTLSISYRSAWR
jgi:Siphovirus-type tail component, C-terminal domain